MNILWLGDFSLGAGTTPTSRVACITGQTMISSSQRDKHEQFTTLHLFLCRQVSKGELSRKYFAGHVCIVYCSSTTICFALFASSGRSTTYLLCRVLADASSLLYRCCPLLLWHVIHRLGTWPMHSPRVMPRRPCMIVY